MLRFHRSFFKSFANASDLRIPSQLDKRSQSVPNAVTPKAAATNWSWFIALTPNPFALSLSKGSFVFPMAQKQDEASTSSARTGVFSRC
jgi:hypothetical protein